ncbi:glycoside hydrolase family 2 protein [Natronococcus wangiae]|uniref:glycoside hydrolase family 2 protein n=1 Tax=Natronococcus wangiae TaxID=3068275 RepID=UPI00273E77D8|nr:sugar-binding domain-containing protein [Natronococcus sp. AD5]
MIDTKYDRDETHRSTRSLNGSWEFAPDPDDVGVDENWAAADASLPSERRRTVTVPHAWQELDDLREYAGVAWYRTTVEELPPGERHRLRFGAVDYEATVWVNGEKVGTHRGGYLPAEFDVTDALVDGENVVAVRVDDPEDISEIPHGKQGAPWYQRVSGIWQDVTLAGVPATRVTGVRISPDLERDAADVVFDATGGDSSLTATVTATRDGETVATASADVDGEGGGATLAFDDPEYWSPENPALYDVAVELERGGEVVDRYEDYFGMRSVESRDGRLYLNGEPYYVRGALDQGYYPETLYRPFDADLFEREIRTAKELGFNLLRKHIKPAHPDFLELADRIGILVWEEPANPTVHTERSKREVRDQIRGMIDRDYNRPSVVVWSLYNEEWGIGNPQGLDEETSLWEDEEKQAYLADLYEEAKAWDPTRLVCDNSGWAHVATDVNDYHRYFVSPDRADAWADDIERMTSSPEENYGATVTDPEDAPRIVSEFGTWGLCDLPAIEEYYGETPPWFDYEFFDDPIKRPEGVYDRYAETTLPEVFDDWEALAEAWQRREFRSNEDVVEQMRADEGIAGYVITEFTDIEWEFNGMLDYRREEKVFHDDFARINDDVLVSVEVDSHALRAGETLTADVVLSNHTTEPIDGDLEWSVFDRSGTISVSIDGFGVARLEDAIAIDVPEVDSVSTDELTVSHPEIPTNGESIAVAPASSADGVTVYADADALAADLSEGGFDVAERLDASVDAALVTDPDDDVRSYVEDGGTVIVVPDGSGHVQDDEFFEYRSLPEDESWNLVSSLFYCDGPAADVVGDVPGWELENCYPYEVVSDVDADDDVAVGYVEGWIANWSAAAVVRDCGAGRVGAFTFRVSDDEPGAANPVAVAALAAFVTDLARD